MEEASVGGGAEPPLAQFLRLHVQEEGESSLHHKQNPGNEKRCYTPMMIYHVFTFRLSLTEIRGRVSPQPTTYGSGQCQFHFQINVKCNDFYNKITFFCASKQAYRFYRVLLHCNINFEFEYPLFSLCMPGLYIK